MIATWAGVSTPSATTSMFSERPISTMVPTSLRWPGERLTGLYELSVDLEPAWAQLHQADDRGMAGAEIVDLDVDAELAHLREVFEHRAVAIVEEDRLQQFEGERARANVERAQRMREVRIMQALGGDIGRDLFDPEPKRLPFGKIGERTFEHDAVDGRHAVEVLGDLQEGVGRQDAARRVVPPGEGLDADDVERAGAELRLGSRAGSGVARCRRESRRPSAC